VDEQLLRARNKYMGQDQSEPLVCQNYFRLMTDLLVDAAMRGFVPVDDLSDISLLATHMARDRIAMQGHEPEPYAERVERELKALHLQTAQMLLTKPVHNPELDGKREQEWYQNEKPDSD
jgi:hypothetical protein